MRLRPNTLLACAALAGAGALSLVFAQQTNRPEPIVKDAPAARPATPGPSTTQAASEPLPQSIRSLVIGGGPLPDSSEVSLEQDVRLALSVLPEPSVALFAGGPGTQSVRIEEPILARSLSVRLGELFAPRASRASRYRPSELGARRADLEGVEDALDHALAEATNETLTVYVAAHGDQGEAPADNAVLVWGNDALTPRRIAQLHDARTRPLRLIVTSCFSGGFAELAFEGADEARGIARAPRCGLFAGTWDRETSGCDPDPNRAAQESYSLHMLQALAGRDRDGAPLPLDRLDLDRDGRVSLLEAHAHARIAAKSIDVPTTTSERYLRSVQKSPGRGPAAEALLPEDAAVVHALSRSLGLAGEAAARAKLQRLQQARAEHGERVADAEDALDAAYWPLVTRLLERFPALDDPYHPEFGAALRDHAAQIDAILTRSPEAREHQEATQALAALDEHAMALELEETMVLRLVRAHETLSLATALQQRGGPELSHYRALLACERAPLGPTGRDGAPSVR